MVQPVQMRIVEVGGKQFVVSAGVGDGEQVMRDDQGGASGHQPAHGSQDALGGCGVQTGSLGRGPARPFAVRPLPSGRAATG